MMCLMINENKAKLEKHNCDCCGDTENLELVKNVLLKTTGNPIPIKKGYICRRCKWRVDRLWESEIKPMQLNQFKDRIE